MAAAPRMARCYDPDAAAAVQAATAGYRDLAELVEATLPDLTPLGAAELAEDLHALADAHRHAARRAARRAAGLYDTDLLAPAPWALHRAPAADVWLLRMVLALVALVLLALVAGCGPDEDGDPLPAQPPPAGSIKAPARAPVTVCQAAHASRCASRPVLDEVPA